MEQDLSFAVELEKIKALNVINLEIWSRVAPILMHGVTSLSIISFNQGILTFNYTTSFVNFKGLLDCFLNAENFFNDNWPSTEYPDMSGTECYSNFFAIGIIRKYSFLDPRVDGVLGIVVKLKSALEEVQSLLGRIESAAIDVSTRNSAVISQFLSKGEEELVLDSFPFSIEYTPRDRADLVPLSLAFTSSTISANREGLARLAGVVHNYFEVKSSATNLFPGSLILQAEEQNILEDQCLPAITTRLPWELLYRGSRDGFSRDKCIEKYDPSRPTVMIVLCDLVSCLECRDGGRHWITNSTSTRCTELVPVVFSIFSMELKRFVCGLRHPRLDKAIDLGEVAVPSWPDVSSGVGSFTFSDRRCSFGKAANPTDETRFLSQHSRKIRFRDFEVYALPLSTTLEL